MPATDEMGYLRTLKTALVVAMQKTFDNQYPDERLRSLRVSIEYPIEKQDYPSIWVNFEESGSLQNAGIAHTEYDEDDRPFQRWTFEGDATYTIAAFSSLERDRIYDEIVRVMAFSGSHEYLSPFREFIESNDFIAMNANFDQIEAHGDSAAPGTPWDTDEVIYERSVSIHVIGEFFTQVGDGNLIRLSKILVQGRVAPSTEEDPLDPIDIVVPTPPYTPGDWH